MVPRTTLAPASGVLLVADTTLLDPNFGRSVVLICEHHGDGTFGLVLNSSLPANLSDAIDNLSWDAPLFRGGPVQQNTLHFLHRSANIDIGSQEVVPGVFWGGSFDALQDAVSAGKIAPDSIRFFVGYSGWNSGQLDSEIERESWFLTPATETLVFCDDSRNHWRHIFRAMGPRYALLANFPDNANLN